MILDEIVAEKRRAHLLRDPVRDRLLRDSLLPRPEAERGRFRRAITADADEALPRVIAEFKRRSPSAGAIRPGATVESVVRGYVAAGASALSILTDGPFFGGALSDLGEARAAVAHASSDLPGLRPVPLLRKDFLLFDEDLFDAAAAGADCALLIVRLLEDAALGRLLALAASLGIDVLVEVHDAIELERALAAGADTVGVNHRNLDTLRMDLDLSLHLAARLPASVIRVAESGLRTATEVRTMRERGYDAVLVGESLLSAPDPGIALRALLGQSSSPGDRP